VTTITDITILGGGPTGLFAAFYAGLRNASCKIIDSMPALGGRLTAVYPEKYIYDVAGFPKVQSKVLVDNLVEQAMTAKPTLCLEEIAENLVRNTEGIWEVHTNKSVHLTRTVVIAAGVGQYTPKHHTALGARELEGKGISYAVIRKQDFAGKRVVIFGGGDSALDWVFELVPLAQKVTLVHRSEKFRAHDASVQKLSTVPVDVLLNTECERFEAASVADGDGADRAVCLEKVQLRNTETGVTQTLDVDDALVMFGFNSGLGKLREWGLTMGTGGIEVNDCMETNLPGVYAAGDITHYTGKLDLIATGFGEAAIAVNFAKHFINPKEKVQPLHSTTIAEIAEKKAARQAKQ
jgi:ferredoxin/flavodoxin---NADP+ reductase